MSKTLEQYTPEEIADQATEFHRTYGSEGGLIEYFNWIDGLRRECFERKVRTMDPGGQLQHWIDQMTAKHGPLVRVFRSSYSWVAALGVVRYGEAPEHWPATFTDDDIVRAKKWLYQGLTPEGVTYITVEG